MTNEEIIEGFEKFRDYFNDGYPTKKEFHGLFNQARQDERQRIAKMIDERISFFKDNREYYMVQELEQIEKLLE